MATEMILIAGPYRSGTDGNEQLMQQNLARLEAAALQVYQAGHVPVIGEWLALPLSHAAGSKQIGDAISEAMLYPVAHRLITKCDAIYRLDGPSRGADMDVELAKGLGLKIYTSFDEIEKLG